MIAYEEKNEHLCNDYLPLHALEITTRTVVPPHWHHYIEILYLMSGFCKIYVDNQLIHLKPNDFLWIPSNTIHYILPSCNSQFLVLQFSPNLLQEGTTALFERKYFIPLLQTRALHLSEPLDYTLLSNYLKEMIHDFKNHYPGYELHIKACLYSIFTYLLKYHYIEPTPYPIDEEVVNKMETVLTYVAVHYKEPLCVSQACEIAIMSYHHFCRTFKKITGKTFMDYVNFIRLREAEKLLLTTSMSITDIAFQVGFMNSPYFSSYFKKKLGLSPLAYRIKHKTINSNHNSHSC